MNAIIWANILGTIGSLIIVLSGLLKKREQILGAQMFQFLFMGLANFVIGGYASVVANALSAVRNLYAFKFGFDTKAKIIFTVILSVVSLSVNTLGWLVVVPIVSTAAFTWVMDKDAKTIKIVVILTMGMWAYYDFVVSNYATSLFDASTVITNIVGIFMINKDIKKKA